MFRIQVLRKKKKKTTADLFTNPAVYLREEFGEINTSMWLYNSELKQCKYPLMMQLDERYKPLLMREFRTFAILAIISHFEKLST